MLVRNDGSEAFLCVKSRQFDGRNFLLLTYAFFFLSLLFCRLYETFDEGSDFYIVTELVEGGELFDRIVSKAHYTEKEARDLIKSLLETLNYMHTTGVVHRDLKPENLLLCSGAY